MSNKSGDTGMNKSMQSEYANSSMPQRRSVMNNRSMKDDHTGSSKPGFLAIRNTPTQCMTPSTNDSRQKIISNKSNEYMLKISQSSVRNLKAEIQDLMRKKAKLMLEVNSAIVIPSKQIYSPNNYCDSNIK
jgi:hypothetical protein